MLPDISPVTSGDLSGATGPSHDDSDRAPLSDSNHTAEQQALAGREPAAYFFDVDRNVEASFTNESTAIEAVAYPSDEDGDGEAPFTKNVHNPISTAIDAALAGQMFMPS